VRGGAATSERPGELRSVGHEVPFCHPFGSYRRAARKRDASHGQASNSEASTCVSISRSFRRCYSQSGS
jgi:hypothetical protein